MPEPTPAAQRELDAIDAALAGRPVEDDLADVAELARALRAERPAIEQRYARDLDAWAARGFRGRDPRAPQDAPARRRPRLTWLKLGAPLAGGLAAVVLAVVVLPGMLSNGSDDAGESAGGMAGGSATSQSAPEPPSLESERLSDESASGAMRDFSRPTTRSRRSLPRLQGQSGRPRGRQVERSASLGLAAPPGELEEVAAGVARVTDDAGGVVARSTVTADPNAGTATFDLRIPSARLSQTLAALSDLAAVRSRTQASVDITRTVNSAAERLEEARAERRGLLRRLERDPSDATRARLRVVSGRLADAKVDLARAERRADLATVSVTVEGDPAAGGAATDATDGRWTPGDALRDAGRVLEVAAGILLVVLAVLVPLALLAAPLVLAGRWRVRRARERALGVV